MQYFLLMSVMFGLIVLDMYFSLSDRSDILLLMYCLYLLCILVCSFFRKNVCGFIFQPNLTRFNYIIITKERIIISTKYSGPTIKFPKWFLIAALALYCFIHLYILFVYKEIITTPIIWRFGRWIKLFHIMGTPRFH